MENDTILASSRQFQDAFEASNIRIMENIETRRQELDGSEWQDAEFRDPQFVAAEVAAQIAFFRKLKFQYLEQSAKDKYVKNIVSNIDDAPLVTAEDNRNLQTQNEERKRQLKVAKTQLADVHDKMRSTGRRIGEDYMEVKNASTEAASLSQKIIDTRLALARLRQAHPQPRLTENAATEKLAEQDEQMQQLTDVLATSQDQVRGLKNGLKKGTAELENLRLERTEAEKRIKTEMDDTRWLPLVDWLTQAITVHRSLASLVSIENVADNEVQLTYSVQFGSRKRMLALKMIYLPGTRQLANVEISGMEDTGIDVTEVIDAHVPSNDSAGVVAAILARVRDNASR